MNELKCSPRIPKGSKMIKPLFVIIALSVISLPGCESLHVDRITLQHTQKNGVDVVPGAANISVIVKANDRRDYLAPGISRKLGKAVVGYGRNGLGEGTYPDIIVTEPVELTLKRSIEDELRARGFRIDPNSSLLIDIDINTFFNDYKVGFIRSDSVADLNFDVKVTSKNGRVLYLRRIAEQGHKDWASTMSGEDARAALNKALDNGLNALFSDGAFMSALTHNN